MKLACFIDPSQFRDTRLSTKNMSPKQVEISE